MAFGLDYSDRVQPTVAKEMGATFVARYVGYFSGYDINNIAKEQSKCLTPQEASELMSMGIGIVSVYEWYGARPSIYNAGSAAASFAAGQWDAHTAGIIHTTCGGPQQAPIYFCVDYDSPGTETVDYFNGVASVLGIGRVGVYGGYRSVKYLLDNSLVSWAWQTYAWSGNSLDPRANIYQYDNGVILADGSEGDYNDSKTQKYGSWKEYEDMNQFLGDNSNASRVALWNSFSNAVKIQPPKQGTGLFGWFVGELNAGRNPGSPIGGEFDLPIADGKTVKAQNFTGGATVAWINDQAVLMPGK